MIIINSNSYLNQSLQIEFGQLPLAFIPINGKRLYELQIQFLNKKYKNNKIFITIPENFELGEADTKKLLDDYDCIIHLASIVKHTQKNSEKNIDINVLGCKNILELSLVVNK